MRDPVEAYFTQLRDIHASGAGVAETTYYGPLATLLTDLGTKLKPKVTAIINLRNTGAGIPDGGLFTAQQLKGWDPGVNSLQGQLPARGAIEVKGTSDDAFQVAASEQVKRYVERYGLVLVTNLRDFVLVGRSADGSGIRELESCRLATSETAFWAHIATPHKFAEDAREGLTEFLRRVLLHNAPLSDPKDVAWFLASYARTARVRLESRHELPALEQLRGQLEESLGLKFEGEKGDHFFRSTLVQTLFYGMFASWVLWARDKDRAAVIDWRDRFQWETASQTLHVPMVAELFYQFSNPGRLRDLHIDEVLEWAEEVLWRIDRISFFERFQEEHAVQYFYEPFLEAFDPQLRKELGVWYTPDEVVKYMVARVDWALREELGIADGLADPSVVVLDPCCGTGAYLVEVLRKIDATLQAKGADALTRQDVKRAAMERVIGFEIMPAPFVVAHLQMGILLAELGVPLKDADERAAVYLTNALTGWGGGGVVSPPKDKRVHPEQMHSTLLFPEFAEERDAADRVKREEKILVVIGNPPYNGLAGLAVDEERELTDAYRTTECAPKPVGQGLNDLFTRFFRAAERRIVERAGRGVICLITNNAWLDSLSFTGMRERYLARFDVMFLDNLNGDKYQTGKLTPDGRPDPSVFSTAVNREGIQVGTAIATLVCRGAAPETNRVWHRDVWGVHKREQLLAEAASGSEPSYVSLDPPMALGLPFVPVSIADGYLDWPLLTDVFASSFSGVQAKRDDFVVAFDKTELEERLARYFDSSVSDEEIARQYPRAMEATQRFDAVASRHLLLARGGPLTDNIVRYEYRPFDVRWLYWEPETRLLGEKAAAYFSQTHPDNPFLFTTGRTRKLQAEPALMIARPSDLNLMDSGARGFPLYLGYSRVGMLPDSLTPNLSAATQRYLAATGCDSPAVAYHVLAVSHSAQYRQENIGGLRHDWPRIPMPADGTRLERSAALGRAAALLLDAEGTPTITLPSGLGLLSNALNSPLDPTTDLSLTARWGIAGKGGITMPSTGKLSERQYTAVELAAIGEHAQSLGMSRDQAVQLLGETCLDVYLNDVAYWRCVPARVWLYTIGGYQVIKKWLSYRERALLGRDLKPEEARYVTEMVRRIAALVLMQPELDANYERVKADVWGWGEHDTQ